jgi:hypothetical protein
LYEQGEKIDLWYVLLSGQLHLHGGPATSSTPDAESTEPCSKTLASHLDAISSRNGGAKVGSSTPARPGSAVAAGVVADAVGSGMVEVMHSGLVHPGDNLVPLRDACAAKDRLRNSSAQCATECQFAVISKVGTYGHYGNGCLAPCVELAIVCYVAMLRL